VVEKSRSAKNHIQAPEKGTVTLKFLKNPSKTYRKATENTSNPKSMEEFLQILNESNIEEDTQAETQAPDKRV
jgi:hypothetical protein